MSSIDYHEIPDAFPVDVNDHYLGTTSYEEPCETYQPSDRHTMSGKPACGRCGWAKHLHEGASNA